MPAITAPIQYSEMLNSEDILFTDQEKFIHSPNDALFEYSEEPAGENKRETFTYKGSCVDDEIGHFCAHIP